MRRLKRLCRLGHGVTTILLSGCLSLSGACATLAHRSSHEYEGKKSVTSCDDEGEVCPWLIGDAVLLIPFILPGVVAFIVDFGTGAWRHDEFPPPEEEAKTAEATTETTTTTEEPAGKSGDESTDHATDSSTDKAGHTNHEP